PAPGRVRLKAVPGHRSPRAPDHSNEGARVLWTAATWRRSLTGDLAPESSRIGRVRRRRKAAWKKKERECGGRPLAHFAVFTSRESLASRRYHARVPSLRCAQSKLALEPAVPISKNFRKSNFKSQRIFERETSVDCL